MTMIHVCDVECNAVVCTVCSIDAVYKVQDYLHQKQPAEALTFLRSSRYFVWLHSFTWSLHFNLWMCSFY